MDPVESKAFADFLETNMFESKPCAALARDLREGLYRNGRLSLPFVSLETCLRKIDAPDVVMQRMFEIKRKHDESAAATTDEPVPARAPCAVPMWAPPDNLTEEDRDALEASVINLTFPESSHFVRALTAETEALEADV